MFVRKMVFAEILFGALVSGAAEIRAVWDHTGRGLYSGNWPKTIAILKRARVTDLFLNAGGVDFAHYASSFLPRTRTFSQYGDQISACLAAARGSGIRIHAWFICFNATRAATPSLEKFRQRGWRLRDAKGALTSYLDPSNPGVRAYALSAIDELAGRYPLAGIHLDFVRWGDSSKKPANAAAVIAGFVAEARRHVKRPKWLTAAVYGKYPNCIATVGQDWPRWLDYDIVDYVVPMDYTSSPTKFRQLLSQQMTPGRNARRTVIGIGVTANESRLNAKQVLAQIAMAQSCGFAGHALFDLDETLEKAILPSLSNGIFQN